MLVAAALSLAGCGSGSEGTAEGQVLFAGPAAALLPHEVGLARRFSIRVERGRDVRTTTVIRRVVASGSATQPDATFEIETLDEASIIKQREIYRDRQSEIHLDEIRFDPGTPQARTVTLPPDTIRYRTPVIAGEEIRSPLALTLEVEIDVGGQPIPRTVLFDANVTRTPREVASIEGSDGQRREAIRFVTATSGQTSLTLAGVTVQLSLESRGEEFVVPGTGQVAAVEEAEIRARVGGSGHDGRSTVRIETRAVGDS